MGQIQKIERKRGGLRLQVSAPVRILRLSLPKGSIAVDGISFTLQKIQKGSFVIEVTPHTYRVTTLKRKRVGDRVNLESDLLTKWLHHFDGRGR